MKKRAEYLDDAAMTLAKHGELGDAKVEDVKAGIVTKTAFVHKTVSMVFDKTSELTGEKLDKELMNKVAGLVDSEFSVIDTMAMDEGTFTDAVLHKTAQIALQLDKEENTDK